MRPAPWFRRLSPPWRAYFYGVGAILVIGSVLNVVMDWGSLGFWLTLGAALILVEGPLLWLKRRGLL